MSKTQAIVRVSTKVLGSIFYAELTVAQAPYVIGVNPSKVVATTCLELPEVEEGTSLDAFVHRLGKDLTGSLDV